ncbi:hypothetical protein ACOM2C_06840 [Pseudarthrobacter sp. So.54]
MRARERAWGPAKPGAVDAPQSPGLRQLTDTISALWEASGGVRPRRPVAGPLPAKLPFPADGSRGCIRLGLLDLPGEQRVTEFGWHPGMQGHLALISGLTGGADAAMDLIVEQLLTCDSDSHIYLLDAGGTFSAAATAPGSGQLWGCMNSAGPHGSWSALRPK